MTKSVIKGMQEAFVEKFEAKRAKYVKVRKCVGELFALMVENPHLVMNREFYVYPDSQQNGEVCEAMKDVDDVVGVYIHNDIYHAVVGYLKSVFSFKYTEDVPAILGSRLFEVDKLIVPDKFIEAALANISSVDSESIKSRLHDYLDSVYKSTFLADSEMDVLKLKLVDKITDIYLGRFDQDYEPITGCRAASSKRNQALVAFVQNYLGIKVRDKLFKRDLSNHMSQEGLSNELAKAFSEVVFGK